MASHIHFMDGGTITSPSGFSAGATFAGIKTVGDEKLDLGLLFSELQCSWAGMFTTSSVKSPSVSYNQGLPPGGMVQGVVVTSGIANTCVGSQGMKDAQLMAQLAAKHLGLSNQEVLVGSTGVIGVELPMALIRSALGNIEVGPDGGSDLAKAITTTDTRHKESAVSFISRGIRSPLVE